MSQIPILPKPVITTSTENVNKLPLPRNVHRATKTGHENLIKNQQSIKNKNGKTQRQTSFSRRVLQILPKPSSLLGSIQNQNKSDDISNNICSSEVQNRQMNDKNNHSKKTVNTKRTFNQTFTVESTEKIVIPITVGSQNNRNSSSELASVDHPVIKVTSGRSNEILDCPIAKPDINNKNNLYYVQIADTFNSSSDTGFPFVGFSKTIPDSTVFGIEEDEPLNTNFISFEKSQESNHGILKNSKRKYSENKQNNNLKLCDVCGKVLNGASSLKSHLKIHQDNVQYPCSFCSKTFKFKCSLVQHLHIHNNESPFVCQVCQAAFRTSGNLKRHAKIHDLSRRDLTCLRCNKEFQTVNGLNAHSRVHNSITSNCDICNKEFTSVYALQRHKVIHKRDTNKFVCQICNKVYTFKSLFTRHMDGHKGIQKHNCHMCSAKFVWKSGLLSHINTHFTKTFKCSKCSASFFFEKKLKTHMKKHAERYACTQCPRIFKFKYLLSNHVRKMHGRTVTRVQARIFDKEENAKEEDNNLPTMTEKPEVNNSLSKLIFAAGDNSVGVESLNTDAPVGNNTNRYQEISVMIPPYDDSATLNKTIETLDEQTSTNVYEHFEDIVEQPTSTKVISSNDKPLGTSDLFSLRVLQNSPYNSVNPNMIHANDPYLHTPSMQGQSSPHISNYYPSTSGLNSQENYYILQPPDKDHSAVNPSNSLNHFGYSVHPSPNLPSNNASSTFNDFTTAPNTFDSMPVLDLSLFQ